MWDSYKKRGQVNIIIWGSTRVPDIILNHVVMKTIFRSIYLQYNTNRMRNKVLCRGNNQWPSYIILMMDMVHLPNEIIDLLAPI